MRFLPVAIGLALSFGLLSRAEAFIFLKGTTYAQGERPVSEGPIWRGRTVIFYVNTNLAVAGGSLPAPISPAELLAGTEAAVNAWSAACRAGLRVEVRGSTSTTYNSGDGINVVEWDNRTTAEGNYYGTSTSTLAAATTALRGSEFADCDIVLNGNSATTMKYSPLAGQADLRSILTHEVGHCLGLDHPIDPPDYTSVDPYLTEATMVQTASTGLDPSDPGRRDINQDDRDAIECLYERGRPFRSGLHCGSYTGTNGRGALSGTVVGGPTVTDTGCGGDSQGRNAHPALESGDGCVTSAVASDGETPPPLHTLGGSFGFVLAVGTLLFFRVVRRRRSLRGSRGFGAGFVAILLGISVARSAGAFDLELSYGARNISPNVWNAFAGMDPQASAWDRRPANPELKSVSEIRAAAFTENTEWGKWGGAVTVMLPTSLDSDAKAQAASDQSKRTTLFGVRLGPDVRWYPTGPEGAVRWFVGGRFALGFFGGSQSFSSDGSAGSVAYRAWAAELALSTGAEIPVGANLAFVAEGGYSRTRSSYFTSTGNSGTAYTDFASGTRIATNTGPGSEDVRFDGSGFYAAAGLTFRFGEGASTETATETPAPVEIPAATPSPGPSPTPAPEPSPVPEASPDPAPGPRNDREPDPIPGMEDARPVDSSTAPAIYDASGTPIYRADPVPFEGERRREIR